MTWSAGPYTIPRGWDAPVWMGVPLASAAITLPQPTTQQPPQREYVRTPEPFLGWEWNPPYPVSNVRPPAPFSKSWRYDYDSNIIGWSPTLDNLNVPTSYFSGTPGFSQKFWAAKTTYYEPPPWTYPWSSANANYIALNIPNARAPFYTQRGAEFPPWQYPDFWENADALYLPVTEPFYKFWRYDYVPQPDWEAQLNYENADALYIIAPEPFKKLWRYDYVPPTDWLGQPLSAYSQQQLDYRPTSPTKLWRWDYVPQPDWLGEPQSSVILIDLSGKPFFKLWRYDFVPSTEWLGTPEGVSESLRNITEEPFSKLWRYDYDSSTYWQWTSPPQPITLPQFVQLYAPMGSWQYNFVPDPPWISYSSTSPALYIPQLVILTGPVPTRTYAIHEQDSAQWQWTPNNVLINLPTGNPFHELWRSDYVPQPDWLGTPLVSNTLRDLSGAPFHRQWRWDNVPATEWIGTPKGISNEIRAVKPSPFHRLWRYDYNSATELWRASPIGARTPYLPALVADQLLRNVIVRTRQLVNEIERERELRNVIVRTRVLPFGAPTYH